MGNKTFKKSLRNVGRTLGGMSEMFIGLALPGPGVIIGVPLIYDGAVRLINGVSGIDDNKSMMVTTNAKWYNKIFRKKENNITQNIPSLSQLFSVLATKDKKNFLVSNELNFLLGADKLDKEGKPITYSTCSQGITKVLLKSAEKAGFIENFSCDKIASKSLIAEKVMFGNFSRDMNKKEKMFNMSFNISDKKITDEDVRKFLRVPELDEKRFNIKRDKTGNITSINQKVSYVISKRIEKLKEDRLISEKKQKMLPESSREKDQLDKTKLTNELSSLVKKPVESMDIKVEKKSREILIDENSI